MGKPDSGADVILGGIFLLVIACGVITTLCITGLIVYGTLAVIF